MNPTPTVQYPETRELRDPKGNPSPWRTVIHADKCVSLHHADRPGWSLGFRGMDYAGSGAWIPQGTDEHTEAAGRTSFVVPKWVLAEVLRDVARVELREAFPPGTTVYTILRHRSTSGMRRVIDPILITSDGPRFWREKIAILLKHYKTSDQHEGIVMDGCGMDMGFSLVYNLSSALYGHDNRGGYALRHEWL